MKKYLFLFLFPFLANAEAGHKTYSFYTGYLLYQDRLRNHELPLNFQEVLEGMKEAHSGEIDKDEIKKFYDCHHDQLKEEKLAEANRFLNQISAQDGVKELIKDKLYYKIEKSGTGPEITEDPLIQYKVKTLVGGKEEQFHQIPEPKSILLKATIKGFSLGVQGMRIGEKRLLYIHPDLAYGSASAKITPNSLIIFEVEAF